MTKEANGQKPEKKWYLKKRMFVVYAILALILIGSVGGSSDSTNGNTASNATPKEEVWTQVAALKGKGNQNSESFDITGDKVRITATTTGSRVGSYSGVSLEKEDGGYMGPGLSYLDRRDGARQRSDYVSQSQAWSLLYSGHKWRKLAGYG